VDTSIIFQLKTKLEPYKIIVLEYIQTYITAANKNGEYITCNIILELGDNGYPRAQNNME
jgi:hypothetical protein